MSDTEIVNEIMKLERTLDGYDLKRTVLPGSF